MEHFVRELEKLVTSMDSCTDPNVKKALMSEYMSLELLFLKRLVDEKRRIENFEARHELVRIVTERVHVCKRND